MRTPPTAQQVADLFGLDDEQRTAWRHIAPLIAEPDSQPTQQRIFVMGNPGCGKSRLLTAALWYSFQLQRSAAMRLSAFTWRAAANVTTDSNRGLSTTRVFGLGRQTQKPLSVLRQSKRMQQHVQHMLSGVDVLLQDEVSMCSQSHLRLCSQSATCAVAAMRATLSPNALQRLHASDSSFGGLHTVFFGDLQQHQPPRRKQGTVAARRRGRGAPTSPAARQQLRRGGPRYLAPSDRGRV